jgi:ribosomal-protein-alanine N-acetyltransferase
MNPPAGLLVFTVAQAVRAEKYSARELTGGRTEHSGYNRTMPAKKSPVQIRMFRAGDLKRVLAVERATFAEGPYTKATFRELYRDCGGLFFVAVRLRRIVGYMVTCVDNAQAEIVSIGVDPKCQKMGIGTRLMEHTLAALEKRGIRRMELMVRTTNEDGVRFYRKFGFRSAGRVSRYYENGGDAFHMRKILRARRGSAGGSGAAGRIGFGADGLHFRVVNHD